MFWHLRMILAYKKTLGKFTKVLGFEKTPPPLWEKFPKNPVFFQQRPLHIELLTELHICGDYVILSNPIVQRAVQPGFLGARPDLVEEERWAWATLDSYIQDNIVHFLWTIMLDEMYTTKCHSIRHQTPKFPTPPKSYATIFFGLLRTLFWSN